MGFLILIAVFFVLMWFVVVLPQRRRQRAQEQLAASLEVGDEVITAGGIYGTIADVGEDEVGVVIAPGTTVRVAKRAVVGLVEQPEEEPEEAGEPTAEPEGES